MSRGTASIKSTERSRLFDGFLRRYPTQGLFLVSLKSAIVGLSAP